MTPCSSCGYQFDSSKLKQVATGSYCAVCMAIGADRIDANPNVFGEAKYFIPPLAWCANHLLAAIATRAEARESKQPSLKQMSIDYLVNSHWCMYCGFEFGKEPDVEAMYLHFEAEHHVNLRP